MAKYFVQATKTIHLEGYVETDSELEAWQAADEMIVDDFEDVGTAFRITQISETLPIK